MVRIIMIIIILRCTAENVIIKYTVELIILNQINPPPLLNSRCGAFSNSQFHMKPLILPICTSQIAPPQERKKFNIMYFVTDVSWQSLIKSLFQLWEQICEPFAPNS